MSRRYTRRGTALLLVLALLVSMLGAALPVLQKSGAASGTFATAYTALLEKAPVAQADLERDPYGLCRLVVTGYGGKDYGAVAAAVTDGLAILQYDTPLAARKAAVQLAQDGATAEPDSLCQLETDTNLTGNLCPWAGEMVDTTAFCARRRIPGHRVVIAQIDTGFMLDHPALQGRLVSDGIDLSGDGRANAAYDTRQRGATYWHATAVASVLAGNTDENVKILPYKVVRFGTDTCAASAVLAAMEDAVAKGARVLNMSLSTSQNRAGFAAMMDKAAALGVAVCCSAGNAGAQVSNRYPSALPQTITVSAVTADKTVAGFSNYGDLVDYCAPGSHITVATMDSGGAPAATTASGTSLSCPYGAACCALLLSLHPDLTLGQLNALLQGSAEDLGDLGFDPIYGNGLLRLDNLTQTGTTGNLTYTLTLPEGTLALTGTGDGADYDRAAATPWALWAEELQQITVADTVTGLGNFTFSGCQNAAFTLPETLQRLGAYVFENCKSLHTITLPRNVVQVGTGAFSGCSDLTVRGWRNTPAPRAAAAAGAAFLPLGCVHNYVCQILRPTDTNPGSLTYTCAVCGDTYTEPYAEPQVLGSGSCGRGVNWTCYATGQLEITGAGRLSAYSSSAAPWAVYADTVSSVFIGQGVTGVTGYAFADMRRVTAFSVAGDDYTVAEGVLYSGDGTELICYPGGRVATDFTIPNGVTAVYAAAFLSAWQLQQVESASAALTVTADGLLYGKNGRTLWMALPQFHQDTLVLRRAVLIAGGAFLLNHTLRTVYATAAVSVEPHGLGTAFSDGFVRRALTVYGLPGSVLETYCGTAIPFYPVNSGACGAETAWQYDLDTAALTISGSGPVADFAADVAPWALFGAEIRQVTVEDGVTALPESSFANCTGLTRVTLGSGIEKLDDNWFAHCRDLTELTVTATDTVFPAAVFAGVGDGLTLYGYYDTSVMDYARQHGLTFVPLGCLHRIYTDSGPAPTCTAGATHSRTCARCGADLGTVELPPNGHTYSETVQTAPTCTATGRSNYTCTVCGDSYTADTPALGHNWVQRAYTAPTCCVAGRVQRYCARCGTEETNILSPTQPEGHFVKGTVTDKAGAPLENISVSLDGTPVAVTNEHGVFLFEGVPCGDYTLTFCGDGCVPRRVPLSVSGGNTTAPVAVLLLVGDLNGDGYVNARDDVLAQRQAVSPSDGANLSVNRVLPKVTLDRIYGVQAKIGVLYIRQSAEENGAYRRQFEVNVRAFNEYRVVDCGFLYGKNMAETDLVPERVGTTNAQGYAVKRMPAACTPGRKVLLYGSSSATGQVSARFYITYTNGVMTKTYLSEVCTYDYDEA